MGSQPPARRLLDGGIGCWTRFRGGALSADPLGDRRAVVSLHRAYADAGADILRSASFALPEYAVRTGARGDALEWLHASLELVEAAHGASHDVWVSLGPTGSPPDAAKEAVSGTYATFGTHLARSTRSIAGVVLETFRSLGELELALAGLRAGGFGGAVWVLLSPITESRLADVDLAAAGRSLRQAKVAGAGVGCTTPDVDVERSLTALATGWDGPLVCAPAAHANGETWIEQTAARAVSCPDVVWIGGCCGVGPTHIGGLKRRLLELA